MFLAVAGLKCVIGIGKHQLSAIAQACNFVVDKKQTCSDKIPATSYLIMRRFWVNSLQVNQIFVTMPL